MSSKTGQYTVELNNVFEQFSKTTALKPEQASGSFLNCCEVTKNNFPCIQETGENKTDFHEKSSVL